MKNFRFVFHVSGMDATSGKNNGTSTYCDLSAGKTRPCPSLGSLSYSTYANIKETELNSTRA